MMSSFQAFYLTDIMIFAVNKIFRIVWIKHEIIAFIEQMRQMFGWVLDNAIFIRIFIMKKDWSQKRRKSLYLLNCLKGNRLLQYLIQHHSLFENYIY